MKSYISIFPFCEYDNRPISLLQKYQFDYEVNNYGRKINKSELIENIKNKEVLICGTEKVDKDVLDNSPLLKIISRVGSGTDSIDLEECKKRNIKILITEDAPVVAVAELNISLLFSLLRNIPNTSYQLKKNKLWEKTEGFLLKGKTVGIMGMGKVGSLISYYLQVFQCKILAYDIQESFFLKETLGALYLTKEEIIRNSDIIITSGLALSEETKNFISEKEISWMQPHAFIINTSRGGIICETSLYKALFNKKIKGAACDVFQEEPYSGNLLDLDNFIATPHIGSFTRETRMEMELQSVTNIIKESLSI